MSGGIRPLRHRALWLGIGRFGIVLTVVLSLVRLPPTGLDIEQGDKIGHLLAYFVLTAWYAQLCATNRALAWRAAAFVALGGVIEVLQSFTQYRAAEWRDLLADAAGVLGGVLVGLSPARNLLAGFDRRL